MTLHRHLATLAVSCAIAAPGCGRSSFPIGHYVQPPASRSELGRFSSKAQLAQYLREFHERLERAKSGAVNASPTAADDEEGDDDGGESITNNQQAGVDEGGIVKAHGDYLVVLRRGRLFSVRIGDKDLAPVSKVDVSPPGSTRQAWYDEMLIANGRIVVVGYSYESTATQIGLFDIDRAGKITYRGTHLLRSNDYYSSRNYASRLIGDKLVFYMPYSLIQYEDAAGKAELAPSMPAVGAYSDGATEWDEVIGATEIYRPIQPTDWPILHTVVTCDLSHRDLDCTAKGIIGPHGRTFYVSSTAVYVWVTGGITGEPTEAARMQTEGIVYRLPLDGGDLGAIRVTGAPVDQFSFREGADGFLDVLVRADGGGDWMWNAEVTAGDVAMLHLPVAAFGRSVGTARREAYTSLPKPATGDSFQNRFVGDHVLYGTGNGWNDLEHDYRVFVHSLRTDDTQSLALAHGVDRIEAMGSNAVVIGSDATSLMFSAIDLGGQPRVADRLSRRGASQGETRSHGFFFKPSGDDGDGVLGLPTRTAGEPGASQLVEGSALITFLRVNDLKFRPLGDLNASAGAGFDDHCQVSCVDWYGNARPIFYRGRVFALLGYELVEGAIDDDSIREIRRLDFLGSLTAIAR